MASDPQFPFLDPDRPWYKAKVGERSWRLLKAKLTGGKYDGGSFASTVNLSDSDADKLIQNMKKDPRGYPQFNDGGGGRSFYDNYEQYQAWLVSEYLNEPPIEPLIDRIDISDPNKIDADDAAINRIDMSGETKISSSNIGNIDPNESQKSIIGDESLAENVDAQVIDYRKFLDVVQTDLSEELQPVKKDDIIQSLRDNPDVIIPVTNEVINNNLTKEVIRETIVEDNSTKEVIREVVRDDVVDNISETIVSDDEKLEKLADELLEKIRTNPEVVDVVQDDDDDEELEKLADELLEEIKNNPEMVNPVQDNDGDDEELEKLDDEELEKLADEVLEEIRTNPEMVDAVQDDDIVSQLSKANQNLLETNLLLAGFTLAMQKEIKEEKKRIFAAKERASKQRKIRGLDGSTGSRSTLSKIPGYEKIQAGLGSLVKFGLLSALAGLVEFIPDIIDFIESLPEKIETFFTETLPNKIQEEFEKLKVNVESFIEESKKTIQTKFDEIYKSIDDFSGGKLTEFIDGIKGLGPMIVEKSEEFYKTIDDWTGGRITKSFNWIQNNVISPLGSFFAEKFEFVKTESMKLWDTVSTKFNSMISGLNLPDLTSAIPPILPPAPLGETEKVSEAVIKDDTEREYLKRLIIAESGGESAGGRATVARSVLNRAALVQSGEVTPGTFNMNPTSTGSVTDVINARGQYTPVREGKLNRPLTPEENEKAEEALKTAQNQEQFTKVLKGEGFTDRQVQLASASTGFRNYDAGAGVDASQQKNEFNIGAHTFNTAGNMSLKSPMVGGINREKDGNPAYENKPHGGSPSAIKPDTGFNAGTGDKTKRIFLHWTAGDYNTPYSAYHTTFLGDGTPVRTTPNYGIQKNSHTAGGNSNSVGLSIAAAGGASEGRTLGKYPPTESQLNAMALEAARLAVAWGWSPSNIESNVMTHGEWERKATSSGILPGKPQRWDLDQLFSPSEKVGPGKSDGGNYMRSLIKKYYTQLKSQQRDNVDSTKAKPFSTTLTQTIDQIDSPPNSDSGTPPSTTRTRRPTVTPQTRAVPNSSNISVTSRRGMRNGKMHQGTDIASPIGTPLYAFTDAVITDTGQESGYGKYIAWKDIYGKEHFYAHLNNILAKKGDKVKAGTVIAKSGETGRGSGPHLHWEYGPEGSPGYNGPGLIDPLDKFGYLAPYGSNIFHSGNVEPEPNQPQAPAPVQPDLSTTREVTEGVTRTPVRRRPSVTTLGLPADATKTTTPVIDNTDRSSGDYTPLVSASFSNDIYKMNTRSLYNIVR